MCKYCNDKGYYKIVPAELYKIINQVEIPEGVSKKEAKKIKEEFYKKFQTIQVCPRTWKNFITWWKTLGWNER